MLALILAGLASSCGVVADVASRNAKDDSASAGAGGEDSEAPDAGLAVAKAANRTPDSTSPDGGEAADAGDETDASTDADETDTSTNADAEPQPLASSFGSLDGLRLDILQLRATPTGTVVTYQIANEGSEEHFGMRNIFAKPGDYDHDAQALGVRLLDFRSSASGPVLSFRLVNEGEDANYGLSNEFNDVGDYDHDGQPTGVRLIDETSGVTYQPAYDESDQCICTPIDVIAPGGRGRYSITFGQGADTDSSYAVEFPNFGLVSGLTLSTAEPVVPSGEGEVEMHTIEVLSLDSDSGGAVATFEITNGGDQDFGLRSEFTDIGDYDHEGQPLGVRLIDEASGVVYRQLVDANGDCLCTLIDTIDNGQTLAVSVSFGAVQASSALALDIPGYGRFSGWSLDSSGSASASLVSATRVESYAGDRQAIAADVLSIQTSGNTATIDVAGDVLFEFDKATLTPRGATDPGSA